MVEYEPSLELLVVNLIGHHTIYYKGFECENAKKWQEEKSAMITVCFYADLKYKNAKNNFHVDFRKYFPSENEKMIWNRTTKYNVLRCCYCGSALLTSSLASNPAVIEIRLHRRNAEA